MDDPTLRTLLDTYSKMYAVDENETAEEAVEENAEELDERRGLWDNIHAKRRRGEPPAKPGEEGYPKTLKVEGVELQEGLKQARKNVGASKCWPGKVAKGTKMKNGREVPNCVPEAYDIILDYLISEGLASDVESADKIMLVMSEDKIKEIVGQAAKEV